MKINPSPQGAVTWKAPAQPQSPPAQADSPHTASAQNDAVIISEQGRALAVGQQSAADSRALYENVYGAAGLGQRVTGRFHEAGQGAFTQTDAPEHYTPDEAERFRASLAFLAGRFSNDRQVQNPFAGLDRAGLTDIIENGQGFTDEERYAALYAREDLDEQYFSGVMGYALETSDVRPLRRAYLELLDQMSPAERLKYPSNEREQVAVRLAESEQAQGTLPSDFSVLDYMQWAPKGRLNLEALLAPTNPEPAPSPEAGPAGDQGSSRLR